MAESHPKEKSESVLVIGAGVMGHGIAQIAAMAGYHTILSDRDEQALQHGLNQVQKNLDKGVARGKVDEATRALTLNQLIGTHNYMAHATSAAFVIEAVPEIIDLKKELFTALGKACGPGTILATNTSSLSVTEIANATDHPERVIGAHFFNPPHIVRLLEVVTTEFTSEETLARTQHLGEKMGRELVLVRDSPGFASSRLGLVLGLEAIRMLESGVASAVDIDRAMEFGYRHPMGPLRLTDLVGLDTRLKIAEYLHRQLGGEQFRPPELLRQMVLDGKLGKKSGQGFYDW